LNHDTRFSVLVVRGDGNRVLRFGVPRPVLVTLAVAAVAGGSVMGALVADWWQLRLRSHELAARPDPGGAERRLMDSVNRRVAEIHREVVGWRALRARMWEPFGPEAAPARPGTGVGGAAVRMPATLAVASADELGALADTVRETGESLRALDRVIARASAMIASLPSAWPVRGSVNSEFGSRVSPWGRTREFHGGMDIAAERGTPVRAPAAGSVTLAGPHAEYGLAVVVDHGQDIQTVYAHLSRVSVSVGEKVARGAPIGLTGNTGRSSGPHLHYEILVRGQPVNPRTFLW
jgi:hypothetical protein